MKTEIFSAAWAREWSRRLNRSASYRDAARDWEGSIALVILRNSRDPDDRLAVYADLVHGECKSARPASAEDLESARYVLTGLAPAWKSVLAGKTAPLMAVMTGKLKLTRGASRPWHRLPTPRKNWSKWPRASMRSSRRAGSEDEER